MPSRVPLILRHNDVVQILHTLSRESVVSLLTSLSETLSAFSTRPGQVHQPPRQAIVTPAGQTTLFKPCATDDSTCIKTVSLGSLGAVKGTITVMAPDGSLEGLMNASEVTAFRTALASTILLSIRQDAGIKVKDVVIFGTGKQAEWALRLLLILCLELRMVVVVGRGSNEDVKEKLLQCVFVPDTGKIFVGGLGRTSEDFQERLGVLLGQADAVFCCTPAEEPLFPKDMLAKEKSVYVSAIGSFTPNMKELEPALLVSPGWAVAVDSAEECLKGAGEVIDAGLKEGDLTDVGVIAGKPINGGALPEEWKGKVVFKCVGLACMDLAVGKELLRIAREKKIGVPVDWFEE